jgi:hypothetical protein
MEPIHKALEDAKDWQVKSQDQRIETLSKLNTLQSDFTFRGSELTHITKSVDDLQAWKYEIKDTMSQIEGGFKALKALGYGIVFSVISTFAGTVWLISKIGNILSNG